MMNLPPFDGTPESQDARCDAFRAHLTELYRYQSWQQWADTLTCIFGAFDAHSAKEGRATLADIFHDQFELERFAEWKDVPEPKPQPPTE